MGSLMAGWSTSPAPSDEALKRSSSSLTREEVQKFWREKNLQVQEHLEEAHRVAALSPASLRLGRALAEEMEAEQKLAGEGGMSTSLPEGNSMAWWTKSKWAFLNDPPTLDLKNSKYVAQFDVATRGQLQAEQLQAEHVVF